MFWRNMASFLAGEQVLTRMLKRGGVVRYTKVRTPFSDAGGALA
jgi:hypothetical protein